MRKPAESAGATADNYHHAVERDVLSAMKNPSLLFWGAVAFSGTCFVLGMGLWFYQMVKGMGVSGLNSPVGWGVYITDFVFWVGIAHSGTLISAVLYLFRAKFRSAFNRAAEAMTIFAVMTAGLFPLIHLGRSWFFFWLLPYPNERLLWVNFRSPLMWDVFAVSTYLTVSAVFFYVGLIPDFGIAKRFHTGARKWAYSILSLGFVGSFSQWKHYAKLYMFLAAFATPLVVSVHSVVPWDFAMEVPSADGDFLELFGHLAQSVDSEKPAGHEFLKQAAFLSAQRVELEFAQVLVTDQRALILLHLLPIERSGSEQDDNATTALT